MRPTESIIEQAIAEAIKKYDIIERNYDIIYKEDFVIDGAHITHPMIVLCYKNATRIGGIIFQPMDDKYFKYWGKRCTTKHKELFKWWQDGGISTDTYINCYLASRSAAKRGNKR